ncbi:MAG: hypothetical protein M0P10_03670 [Sphaerochaetaceae bacterium]|nr:hypothetical protein [Sphaerochaetaceae bacterium]
MKGKNKTAVNYYKALKYIIDLSNLNVKEFALAASISESLVRHADDTWNPKYTTIEKICNVIHISVPSFYIISDHLEGYTSKVKLDYCIQKQNLSPQELSSKLRKKRTINNITEGKLATKTGFDKSNISKRESQNSQSIMLCSTLEIYADSFGLSMRQLSKYLYE